jgi:diguanylate cyclase (GGDEF)-like protein
MKVDFSANRSTMNEERLIAASRMPIKTPEAYLRSIMLRKLTRASYTLLALAAISPCLCLASPAPPLTTMQALASLTNAQASKRLPVDFQAIVTYFRPSEQGLFVQSGNAAVYVEAVTSLKLQPGDRVQVRGTTHESFRPYVESSSIVLLGHGPLPEPAQFTYEQMIGGQADCRLVTADAVVLSADIVSNSAAAGSSVLVPSTFIQMLVDGGHVDAKVDSDDAEALTKLLDAEVEITGVVSGQFDNKMQQTGILFHVPSLADIKVIKRAANDPWSLPIAPMDRLITGYRSRDESERLRVHGTITYYQPGVALVLQDGAKSTWIGTQTYNPLRVGDIAEAIGFPDVENGFLRLTRAEVRDSSMQSPIVPPLFTWHQLASGGNTAQSQAFNLVSIEATVVTKVQQATQDEYVLRTDGHLFSAIIRQPPSQNHVPLFHMRDVPVGARVRVTGICLLEDANPFNGDDPFTILMRSYDDIEMIARPSWMTVPNLIILAAILLLLVVAVGARSWALERKVRRENATAAYVEQRRGRILEDINNAKPLDETLLHITQLVSCKLHGAACWCQIAGGPAVGNHPASLNSLRIVQEEIPSRLGPPHGTIFASFDARTKPEPGERNAIATAASLASLAIETSQLYTDLVHRSEFDLLTDLQNRFAMEKTFDGMILKARLSAGAFGLIYIDLDAFKQINDIHGHLVGDMYLQEVAQRMKRQLRPGDTLSRLGGDEFAALVSAVRNRTEVEEIAERLKRCFDQSFDLGTCVLQGSASIGIAVYPDDADTKDGLLRAADGAMYRKKRERQGASRAPAGRG